MSSKITQDAPKKQNHANSATAAGARGPGLSEAQAQRIFGAALSHGGALAELYFERTASTRIVYEDQKIDRILEGKDQGCGVRVLADGRSVYGYTTSWNAADLETLAHGLAASIEVAPEANTTRPENFKAWMTPKPKSSEMAQYKIKKDPRALGISEKVAWVKRAEAAARAVMPHARQITAIWLDTYREIWVYNSDGTFAPDAKQYLQMVVQVVGEKDGRVESAYESDGGYVGVEFLENGAPEEIGRAAAKRVQILLDAEPAPAGTLPVVLASEAGGTMIHEAVGHGLEADLACNGMSVYQGKVGELVASPLITVIDDGGMPEKRGSFVYDDEGTPAQRTVLIEKGVLQGYLVDRLSALKFDLMATGNGRRETFRSKPIVRMTNTYIAPGKDDPAEILRSTRYGVYVKSMGGGQVNTVTGDFVFAVTEGYLIEEGRITRPIRGATLVGNGPQVLKQVDRVGSDLGFSTGTCGKDGQGAPVTDAQPTIRIPAITVGGEVPIEKIWPGVAASSSTTT